jgi:hypothetical protein
LDANDLVGLPSLGFQQRNGNFADLLESFIFKKEQMIDISDNNDFNGSYLNSFGPPKMDIADLYPQVVHVLPLVDIKALLIGLVGNAVPGLLSYHHLVALYAVIHYIF